MRPKAASPSLRPVFQRNLHGGPLKTSVGTTPSDRVLLSEYHLKTNKYPEGLKEVQGDRFCELLDHAVGLSSWRKFNIKPAVDRFVCYVRLWKTKNYYAD